MNEYIYRVKRAVFQQKQWSKFSPNTATFPMNHFVSCPFLYLQSSETMTMPCCKSNQEFVLPLKEDKDRRRDWTIWQQQSLPAE